MISTAEHRYLSSRITIISAMLFAGLFGVLTIFLSPGAVDGAVPLLPLRQLGHLLLSLLVLIWGSRLPFKCFQRAAVPGLAVSVLLLLYLPFSGHSINNMYGWYRWGGLSFQPSEPAKLFLVLVLAKLGCGKTSEWQRALLMSAVALMLGAELYLQPDLGMLALYLAMVPVMLLLGRFAWYWSCGCAAGAAALLGLMLCRFPYAWRRLTAFWHPELDPTGNAWHVMQFRFAISRGGWFGAKSSGALWSSSYLPLAYNDSAFAAALECLGLLGILVPVAVIGLLYFTAFRLAEAPDLPEENRLVIRGATALLAIQSLLHISVNLTLLPPTGLPLPFFSYGGSSALSGALLLAAALSAGRPTTFPGRKADAL